MNESNPQQPPSPLKQYCVRVVQTRTPGTLGVPNHEGCPIDDVFLEVLQVAGMVIRHEVDPKGLTVMCFDLECNDFSADSYSWASRIAEKMVSFGFNAVVAPSTR